MIPTVQPAPSGRFWSRLPLRAKGGVLMAIPLVVTALLAASVFRLAQDARTAAALGAKAVEGRVMTQSLLEVVLEAQSGVRAYALTGDPRYLIALDSANAVVPARMAGLRGWLAFDPTQVERLAGAEVLVARRLARLDSTVAQLRQDGRFPPALADLELRVDTGQDMMDSLRAVLTAAQAAADEESRRQATAAAQLRRTTAAVSVIGLALGIVAALLSAYLFAGIVNRVRGVEARARRFVTAPVAAPGTRGRGDEVMRLEAVVHEVGAALRQQQRELMEQRARAEAASQFKSAFLANMSHELRTPLNGVIGFAEFVRDGKAGPVTAEQHEYLGDVLTSARHLLHVINDVLDMARVESGTIEVMPEPVALAPLVAEVRHLLRMTAEGKRIEVETECAPDTGLALADPPKLRQVLYNYMSNAIKFTPPGGRVVVRTMAVEDGRVRLEVEDSGIGIAAEDIPRLFVEFQQLDSGLARRHEGTGLGLALTRRIVEAHGGEVGVRSRPGHGSLFFAVLPAAPAVSPAAVSRSADSARETGSRSTVPLGA
jgi:signal transduction histidine kinase